jgi:serine/threonine protein kinase
MAKSTAKKPSPNKPSKRREGLKLPPAFNDLGPIGAGAFSTIRKAQHIESGTELAVKAFPDADAASSELSILRLVSEARHAHIANMLAEDAVEGGTLAYLHYCSGGSLAHHLAKMVKKQLAMNEANGVVLAAQMASALQHIHALGVAHRDVKPANILYDGRRWRLCDFGFAVVAKDRKLRDQLGSVIYCAPEILSGKSAYTGWAVDMWALGALLYEMRAGRPCFVAADEPTLRLRIQKGFKGGTKDFPWGERMSNDCREVISALLLKTPPEERLRAQQVLEHQWVSDHCTPGEAAPPAPGASASVTCGYGADGGATAAAPP